MLESRAVSSCLSLIIITILLFLVIILTSAGDVKEKDFGFAPVVGAGLSYALSPRLQLDWKAGWSFHELHTSINSHTIREFDELGNFEGSTSYDNSTTSTKTDLTEFQVGFGVKYFF